MSFQIIEKLTPVNFRKGRRATADVIAIHVIEGTLSSARSWFRNRDAEVSSHYGIGDGGEIERWVREEDEAWANGRVYNATAAIVKERPGVNPNAYTISIEHEGDGTKDLTPKQRDASVWLIRDIVRRRPQIRIDRRHIIGHREIYARKACPGKIDVDRLVREAAASSPAVREIPERPRVVWSNYLGDYLVVVRVVNDREWYFIESKKLAQRIEPTRAMVRLSDMPTDP